MKFKIENWKQEDSVSLNGKYFVTDPCYVIPNEQWDEFCENLSKAEEKSKNHSCICTFDMNGKKAVVFGTAYGDGEYPVYKNDIFIGRCGVDAGLLSLLPVTEEELNDEDQYVLPVAQLGVFVELNTTLEMPKEGNVVSVDDGFKIITDGEDEEEEYEEDEEDDED